MEKKEEIVKGELKEEVLDNEEHRQEEQEHEQENQNEQQGQELKDEEIDEGLENQLEEKDKRIEELTDSLLRLQADFTNYKNRVKKERENIFAYATEDLINQLLPILDNFERALDSSDEEDGFYQGVEMIYEQFLEVLKNNGLCEIECKGEAFDPNLHHAVFVEETKDKEEGIILEVLQKGYTLNDKVIRPSMVKVSK